MNERRFKDYLMVMLVKANSFGSTNALIKACEAANAIPEEDWHRRKNALNAIAAKAPLRKSEFLCVVHADIPRFMQEQWENFSEFQHLTRRNYRFTDLVEKGVAADQEVVDHVLTMQEKYGFTNDENSVADAVQSSAGLLGITLDPTTLQATSWAVLEQQAQLEQARAVEAGKDATPSP